METRLYCFTGTGNSLWVARNIARSLGGADIISLADWESNGEPAASRTVGLIFPVYIWGLPSRIIRFVETSRELEQSYVFAIAVNGGQVANTLVQLAKLLRKRGSKLSCGFEITMPSNYIPWGGPGPEEKWRTLFEPAQNKITRIAASVRNKETKPVEKGPLWQRVFFTLLYKLSFSKIPGMDKSFWVDDKCNHCGTCGKICPSLNITFQAGKPIWNRRCEQCFACLQWCPKEAIQYGKRTPKYKRYHHPEINLKEILASRGAGKDVSDGALDTGLRRE